MVQRTPCSLHSCSQVACPQAYDREAIPSQTIMHNIETAHLTIIHERPQLHDLAEWRTEDVAVVQARYQADCLECSRRLDFSNSGRFRRKEPRWKAALLSARSIQWYRRA